jgi:hypothetical protein
MRHCFHRNAGGSRRAHSVYRDASGMGCNLERRMIRMNKAAADHERMAAYYARLGKSKAAARELRKAEALRKANQIKRELQRAS